MKGKKKCSFRMPVAEKIDATPYCERWAIYCDCNTTLFGNTKEECERTWRKHVDGQLK